MKHQRSEILLALFTRMNLTLPEPEYYWGSITLIGSLKGCYQLAETDVFIARVLIMRPDGVVDKKRHKSMQSGRIIDDGKE